MVCTGFNIAILATVSCRVPVRERDPPCNHRKLSSFSSTGSEAVQAEGWVPEVRSLNKGLKESDMMKRTIKWVGAGMLVLLSSGTLGADTAAPDAGELLQQVAVLQQSISDLEASGDLSRQRAHSLGKKLEKVAGALAAVVGPAAGDDVTAQQLIDPLLRGLGRAIDALLDFISELTRLVTELPPEVIQPIVDGAIEVLRGLFDLLLA